VQSQGLEKGSLFLFSMKMSTVPSDEIETGDGSSDEEE
jgi:hypothetical protein